MTTYIVKTISDFIPPCVTRTQEVEARTAEAAKAKVRGIVTSVTVKK